jgi:leader peptidase (prepilin peptidase)/N-methyltransferase
MGEALVGSIPLIGSQIMAFIVGCIFGSFYNVVIYRLPAGQSIVSPASRCPACGNAIAPYDNIPLVSYLLLGGKCRHCKISISPRYPLV